MNKYEKILKHIDPDSGNVSASWYDETGERYTIENLHENDYDLIRAALINAMNKENENVEKI